MFILKRQDVEIANVRHPEKDQQIPILSYQGQTFTLLNVFNASQAEEARAFWRDLTDNRGKACVLLEEPERFSVWGKVRLGGGGDVAAAAGGGGAAPAALAIAALLLFQGVYFDIEDLLGDRQAGKFQKDASGIFNRLQLPAHASPEAVVALLNVDPFEGKLPEWQESQITGLLQEVYELGKVYFGNANFTGRALATLQDMDGGDLTQFTNWMQQNGLGKLWTR